MLLNIKKAATATARGLSDPYQELDEYLKEPLREAGTNAIAWWAVS
jgi:hypothetical protein